MQVQTYISPNGYLAVNEGAPHTHFITEKMHILSLSIAGALFMEFMIVYEKSVESGTEIQSFHFSPYL